MNLQPIIKSQIPKFGLNESSVNRNKTFLLFTFFCLDTRQQVQGQAFFKGKIESHIFKIPLFTACATTPSVGAGSKPALPDTTWADLESTPTNSFFNTSFQKILTRSFHTA